MNSPSKSPETVAKGSTPVPDITVIGGAGHVGIPLVLAFAESGMTVNVNDLNEATLATLRSGKLPFIEHGAGPLLVKALKDNRLVFTSSPTQIQGTGPVVVTIGTPVDEFLNPVTAAVQRCIDDLLPHIAEEQLIVFIFAISFLAQQRGATLFFVRFLQPDSQSRYKVDTRIQRAQGCL